MGTVKKKHDPKQKKKMPPKGKSSYANAIETKLEEDWFEILLSTIFFPQLLKDY